MSKDKRTKGQILKLLDKAIEQEERFADKIKTLQADLADCRKKAEDPRSELTEEAISGSKVSFRIDYYRTAEKSPQKGIIEHLPSRQNKVFEGEGLEAIGTFIGRFLNEEPGSSRKKKPFEGKKGGHAAHRKTTPETAILTAADSSGIPIETSPAFRHSEVTASGLLQRLRAKVAAENQIATGNLLHAVKPLIRPAAATPPLPESTPLLKRVREAATSAEPEVQKPATAGSRLGRFETKGTQTEIPRMRLLDRVRAEFGKSL